MELCRIFVLTQLHIALVCKYGMPANVSSFFTVCCMLLFFFTARFAGFCLQVYLLSIFFTCFSTFSAENPNLSSRTLYGAEYPK